MGISCSGSASTVLFTKSVTRRGHLPHIWVPLHSGKGALVVADTFTDTAYNASAVFSAFPITSATWVIIETTDTWTPPAAYA